MPSHHASTTPGGSNYAIRTYNSKLSPSRENEGTHQSTVTLSETLSTAGDGEDLAEPPEQPQGLGINDRKTHF